MFVMSWLFAASGLLLPGLIWIISEILLDKCLLYAKADYVTKLHAICVQCGNIANYSLSQNTQ